MITNALRQLSVASVVPFDLVHDHVLVLDLTENNNDLAQLDLSDTAVFSTYIFEQIQAAKAVCAIGGYLENRYIYRRSQHFQQGTEPRSIHLGIDIWATAGTPVFAPLAGKVHSFANNNTFGDYGATIILSHEIGDLSFYTLYGHLSLSSLVGLSEGMHISQGTAFAQLGDIPENGHWPPHLHFQLMTDMLGKKGDFPGVCAPSEKDFYQKICLDANLLLRASALM